MRGRGVFLRGFAWLGCLVAAVTATACAGASSSSSLVPGATRAAAAAGAPVAVASAVVAGSAVAQHAPRTTAPKPTASRLTATDPAVALLAAGNPGGHATVPVAGQAVDTSHPDHVIGRGTPASCTPAAVVAAVAAGGVITFSCGPNPVTITMAATATVTSASHQVVLDGGGKVTLSGGGTTQILSMNAGWEQQWPQLVVQNLTFTDAYSGTQQVSGSSVYGGGAIFDEGGQLKVVNSTFLGNSCYASGPDLGGGAIRAVGMYLASPVYVTDDTFSGNSCSNGGALSGLYANFDVINSLVTGNKAIGWGANPAAAGTPGGGSGGAIYTDGNQYNLNVTGTVMRDNTAREGGGGIFFVVNSGGGALQIESSTLQGNSSGAFQNAPGIFDSVNGQDTQPVVVSSSIG
ncbi:MAG TPA: hypothetical protein VHT26_04070 [Trebonia sp.]|nr:hypothetical protein [Trebonia sp.]